VLVRRDAPLRPAFRPAAWRGLVADILPYSIATALSVIYFRVSVIAVSLTASAQELGYFSTSFRIVEVLITIPGLVVTAAFPIFAHAAVDDRARFTYAVGRVFQVCLIVGVWFSLALALGAPIAIAIVGGPKFKPAEGVLVLQALGLGGSFVTAVWGMALLGLRRNRDVLWLNAGGLVAGAALVALLGLQYGAKGAALGTAITEAGIAVIGPFLLARAGVRVAEYLGVVWRVAVAAAVGAAVVALPGRAPMVEVIVATVLYAGVLLGLRALPPELGAELRRLRSRRERVVEAGGQ
jgi:O-antigen/teichoic acid export membrane protein